MHLRGNTRRILLLIGTVGLLLFFLLWPAIRPARIFIGHEFASIKSETISQSEFGPPIIRLLVETSDGALTVLSTKASFFERSNNIVCVRKYETENGATSYDITLLIKCEGI